MHVNYRTGGHAGPCGAENTPTSGGQAGPSCGWAVNRCRQEWAVRESAHEGGRQGQKILLGPEAELWEGRNSTRELHSFPARSGEKLRNATRAAGAKWGTCRKERFEHGVIRMG